MLLHQRTINRQLIQVWVTSTWEIAVYQQGRKITYSGLPTKIESKLETIERARRLLSTASIQAHSAKVIFHTDLTRLRGGIPPFGAQNEQELFRQPIDWQGAVDSLKYGKDYAVSFVKKHSTMSDLLLHGISFGTMLIPQIQALSLPRQFLMSFGLDKTLSWLKDYIVSGDTNAVKTILGKIDNDRTQKRPYHTLIAQLKKYLVLSDGSEAGQTKFFGGLKNLIDSIVKEAPDFDAAQTAFNTLEFICGLIDVPMMSQTVSASRQIYHYGSQWLTKGYGYYKSLVSLPGKLKQGLTLSIGSSVASAIFSAANFIYSIHGFHSLKKFITHSFRELEQANQKRFQEICDLMAQHHGEIIKTLAEGFAKLHDDLQQLRFFLDQYHEDLKTHLYRIEATLNKNTLSIYLQNFNTMVATLNSGLPFASASEYQAFQRTHVIPWCSTHCHEPLLNGATLPASSDADIVHSLAGRSLDSSLGYLAKLYNYYGLLPEIGVYVYAIDSYLYLRNKYQHQDSIFHSDEDATQRNLFEIMQLGLNVWNFSQRLQSDAPFWDQLITRYVTAAEKLVQDLVQQLNAATPIATMAASLKAENDALNAIYLQLCLFIELAFNVSYHNDPLLKLLLQPHLELKFRLISAQDLQAYLVQLERDKVAPKKMTYHLTCLLAELQHNISLLRAMIADYQQDIKAGKQQCHTEIALSLFKFTAFTVHVAKHFTSEADLAEQGYKIPDMQHFPLPKANSVYLADDIFYRVRVGEQRALSDCLTGHKEKLQTTNALDETPLHYAARHGDAELTNFLVTTFSPELDAKDKFANTPLLLAVANGHTDVAEHLIKAGANSMKTNQFGESAASLAKANGDEKLIAVVNSGKNLSKLLQTGKLKLVKEVKAGRPDKMNKQITITWLAQQYLIFYNEKGKNLQLYDLSKPDGKVDKFPASGVPAIFPAAGCNFYATPNIEDDKLLFCYQAQLGGNDNSGFQYKIYCIFFDFYSGELNNIEFETKGSKNRDDIIMSRHKTYLIHYSKLHPSYSGGKHHQILLVDLKTGKIADTLNPETEREVKWIKAVDTVLLVCYAGNPSRTFLCEVYDLNTKSLLHKIKFSAFNMAHHDYEFTVDSKNLLFYAFDQSGNLLAWNFLNNKIEHTYLTQVSFSQELCPSFILNHADNHIIIYNFQTGKKCEIQHWNMSSKQLLRKHTISFQQTRISKRNLAFDYLACYLSKPGTGYNDAIFYETKTGKALDIGKIFSGSLLGSWQNILVFINGSNNYSNGIIHIYELTDT
jgi:hypothetical protein